MTILSMAGYSYVVCPKCAKDRTGTYECFALNETHVSTKDVSDATRILRSRGIDMPDPKMKIATACVCEECGGVFYLYVVYGKVTGYGQESSRVMAFTHDVLIDKDLSAHKRNKNVRSVEVRQLLKIRKGFYDEAKSEIEN